MISTWYLKSEVLVAQLCLTLVNPWSVHGILQARILERVAIPFSGGSSGSRDLSSDIVFLICLTIDIKCFIMCLLDIYTHTHTHTHTYIHTLLRTVYSNYLPNIYLYFPIIEL